MAGHMAGEVWSHTGAQAGDRATASQDQPNGWVQDLGAALTHRWEGCALEAGGCRTRHAFLWWRKGTKTVPQLPACFLLKLVSFLSLTNKRKGVQKQREREKPLEAPG